MCSSDLRTYKTLSLLTEKSQVSLEKEADDLLPSLQWLMSISATGTGAALENNATTAFAGLSLSLPLTKVQDKAAYETAKLTAKKTMLSAVNTHDDLKIAMETLFLRIQYQLKQLNLSEEKIKLAQSVLDYEAENYSYGKVSLNDYIDAVNKLDAAKFNKITEETQFQQLMLQWLKLTDTLVTEIQ